MHTHTHTHARTNAPYVNVCVHMCVTCFVKFNAHYTSDNIQVHKRTHLRACVHACVDLSEANAISLRYSISEIPHSFPDSAYSSVNKQSVYSFIVLMKTKGTFCAPESHTKHITNVQKIPKYYLSC